MDVIALSLDFVRAPDNAYPVLIGRPYQGQPVTFSLPEGYEKQIQCGDLIIRVQNVRWVGSSNPPYFECHIITPKDHQEVQVFALGDRTNIRTTLRKPVPA